MIVRPAERVAIVGLDRLSAEVFVNLVTGTTLPETGRIALFGRQTSDVANGDEWLSLVDRVGIVSERAVLLESLTALQNLAMPFTLDIEPIPADVLPNVTRLADEVGLREPVWTAPVAGLPAADQMRVRVGRALALDPPFLLLEHMTAGLAPDDGVALGRHVRELAQRRGAALVAATSDEPFARAVATRVLRWEPSTGRLSDRKAWFGGRLG